MRNVTEPMWEDTERHDLKPTLVILNPFLFPPKKRGKKNGRMKSKNRDFKSCLSARSSGNVEQKIPT